MKRPLLAALVLTGITHALAAQAQTAAGPDLAPLLAGFERCEANSALIAFQKAAYNRFGNDSGAKAAKDDSKVVLPIPAAMQAGAGAARSKLFEEYTEVTLPLSGRYQGLKVKALTLYMGNENGISIRMLEFDEPVAAVRARFSASLAAAQKKLNKGDGGDVTFEVTSKLPTRIMCDFST